MQAPPEKIYCNKLKQNVTVTSTRKPPIQVEGATIPFPSPRVLKCSGAGICGLTLYDSDCPAHEKYYGNDAKK